MADTENTAAPKKEGRPVITRRALCVGLRRHGGASGPGRVRYAGSARSCARPTAQDEEALVSACIRCEKCYEICPRDVIAPAHLEDGVLNMRTPTFDFSANWCDWCAEEHDGTPLCVSACPTEALKLPDDATAENTIIGKAVINTDWCLAYKLIGCRFCYDACPYEAMELDENNRPVVIEDKCNGCGACESVCVSLQNGSISEGATARAIVVHPLDEVEG